MFIILPYKLGMGRLVTEIHSDWTVLSDIRIHFVFQITFDKESGTTNPSI